METVVSEKIFYGMDLLSKEVLLWIWENVKLAMTLLIDQQAVVHTCR